MNKHESMLYRMRRFLFVGSRQRTAVLMALYVVLFYEVLYVVMVTR